MKNVETEANSKKIKMAKEEIMKQLKESPMSEENVNKDNEEPEVVKEMDKIIESNKCSILCLAYQQEKISERFKANVKFISMVNQPTSLVGSVSIIFIA